MRYFIFLLVIVVGTIASPIPKEFDLQDALRPDLPKGLPTTVNPGSNFDPNFSDPVKDIDLRDAIPPPPPKRNH
uniref:Putative salivary secreted protein n=1 Tax=Glossina morsitans morsitans TaxID=37546 RepID=D3TR62_GLOMM